MPTTNVKTPGADPSGCNRKDAEGNEPTTQMKEGSAMTLPTSAHDATQWLDASDVEWNAAQINHLDVLTVGCIVEVLERMAVEQGKPFRVVATQLWNADGEPTGFATRIDLASTEVLVRVVERLADVIQEELDAGFTEPAVAAPAERSEDIATPTAADIADLMQSMPGPGAPVGERAAWIARKHELLARIEEAKR